MRRINIRILKSKSAGNLRFLRKFQPSRHYDLSCESVTKIEKTKLQPMPPPMISELLPVRFLDINSTSNGIDGGRGCKFFSDKTLLHLEIFILYYPLIHYHPRISFVYIRVSSIGTYRNMGRYSSVV